MNVVLVSMILTTGFAHAATPGLLDPSFEPVLRNPVVPAWSTLAPDGRVWTGGGFDRANGNTVSDLLILGVNGDIASEPVLGYLSFGSVTYSGAAVNLPSTYGLSAAAFPLADGSFLLPSESGNWLRVSAAGVPGGTAFPGLPAGEIAFPQFEREGKIWLIRRHPDGSQTLERRFSADGSVDPEFSQGTDWPDDVLGTVPGALGGAWVLTGDPGASSGILPFEGDPPDQHVFLVHGSGAIAGEERVLSGYRSASLRAAADDEFRVILGPDRSGWRFWPQPTVSRYSVEWCSAGGVVEQTKNFVIGLRARFLFAEGEDGSFVATYNNGSLRRYAADSEWNVSLQSHQWDESFQSPGEVGSVISLPEGKWLVDGSRRLNADGSPDATWDAPVLDSPGQVSLLHALPGGGVLAAGNFSSADGAVRKGLALFRADGSLDPAFVPDERIGKVLSIAFSGEAIFLATAKPVAIRDDLNSNLVKLRLDGSIDERFKPPLNTGALLSFDSGRATIDGVAKLAALKGGDLLVKSFGGYEVQSTRVSLIKPNGWGMPSAFLLQFQAGEILPTKDGGFALGGVFHRADGSVRKSLAREGYQLNPLCEWQNGVLFLETGDRPELNRLRLWNGKTWSTTFKAPRVSTSYPVLASPGGDGTLYLYSALNGSRPALRRLLANGTVDRSFRVPVPGHRLRREEGDWWTAGDAGKIPYDPALYESDADYSAVLWHGPGARLWLGGNFNVIDGKSRDGLGRVFGGKAAAPRARR